MRRQALLLVASWALASAALASDRWSPAEEWEDADLVLFYTGELRGYVEPCG